MGPGAAPDTAVDPGIPPGTVAPGESLVLRVPVRFESLAVGHHVVAGEVAAPGTTAPFEIGLRLQPWGLYAVVAVVAVVVLAAAGVTVAILWGRRRGRHEPDYPISTGMRRSSGART